jgi:hypothetical protein
VVLGVTTSRYKILFLGDNVLMNVQFSKYIELQTVNK